MAITDTEISETFIAGAPDLRLKGDLRPNEQMASGPGIGDSRNELAIQLFGKELHLLSEEEMSILDDEAERLMGKFTASSDMGDPMDNANEHSMRMFNKPYDKLTPIEIEIFEEEMLRLQSKFMAEGGRAHYGLGSLVKSIGKGVKKFVKSDIGKAALIAAGGYYLGGGTFGGLRASAPGFSWGNLGASLGLGTMTNAGVGGGQAFVPGSFLKGAQKFLGSSAAKWAAGGAAAMMLADGMSPEQVKEITQDKGKLSVYLRDYYSKLNPDAGEEEISKFVETNTSEYAGGGRVGLYGGDTAKAASIMGNLPLRQTPGGINELDLRNTGGFIPPVGVKEKADDVPAMLSNNEFVFTADAVKAAGGGSVDKGAQRLYDQMKGLEGRVA